VIPCEDLGLLCPDDLVLMSLITLTKVRDRVVLVNNVTALNKLASEIGRDAVKVINDINTKSSEHNRPRSSQGPTRVKEHPQLYAMLCHYEFY
jgi:hypothetical protein